MSAGVPTSADDVFINCPFDARYAPTLEAMMFTVLACGFRVRTALELDDSSRTRIDKIYRRFKGASLAPQVGARREGGKKV